MAETEVKPTPKAERIPNPIVKWLTTHWLPLLIGFCGALASMAALIPAFFPWLVAPKRELCYCVNPLRAPLVQTVKNSDISVRYKDKPVSGDVTIAQVAIWNAGREPIKPEHILDPIRLNTAGNARILEINFLSVRRVLSQFGFTVPQPPGPTNSIHLSWKILEHDDGGYIQIVYEGTTETPITLSGAIEGQEEIKQVTSQVPYRKKVLIESVIWIFLWSISGGICASLVRDNIFLRPLPKKLRGRFWWFLSVSNILVLIVAIGAIAYATRKILGVIGHQTPFGF